MLYRETESVGEVFIEKEYEGTPQEIAELIQKEPVTNHVIENKSNLDISEIAGIVAEKLRTQPIKKGVR